ncbi:SGNH/GDSL hydrolase family protein [Polyangium jinanense]|uniref:SGNH hydrolase-type esterase domain-containing protein n=1 Tax=Polyangium jinanense TaxID=2829994 RepID=A0A9X4AUN2_9BACT|nr:hypothetical protein [Polyangium jinanense]MDC3958230.1 hypothetical protein [Polyangium jinanense]MDC3983435.1 hypothetical protein [Polyangium jinanense]
MRTSLHLVLAFSCLLGLSAAAWLLLRRPPAPTPPLPPPEASTAASSPLPPPPPIVYPTPFSVPTAALPPREALPPDTLRLLVVGDSVASFLGMALRYRQDEAGAFVAVRGVGSCSIFEAKIRIENGKPVRGTSCSEHWIEDAAELHPDMTLLVMGGAFFNEKACEPAWQDAYEKRIFTLADGMGTNAGRIVLTRVPYPIKDWRYGNVPARVDCLNGMLERAARKRGWPVLDLMGHVCPTPACRVESEGKPIRPDGLHFDGAGAEETARWVLGELERFAREEKDAGF